MAHKSTGPIAATLTMIVLLLAAGTAAASPSAPALLRKLAIAKENDRGYDRDKFNHWTTVPGKSCDTRDYVLYRQSNPKQTYCGAEKGRWFSAYDGLTLNQAGQLDVDHMVPLAEVWASGGFRWTAKQRESYANDLYPFTLVAVSLSSNRSKGDSDPAEWLPPRRAYICRYLARWTAVKYRWKLTVDPAEKRAITRRFTSCPKAALTLPQIKRARVSTTQGGNGEGNATGNDPRFTSCTAAIAAGYGPYRKGVDPEYWWYTDGDGDGTTCEN